MKKIVMISAVLLLAAMTISAGEMTLGVKGSLALSANKWGSDAQEMVDAFTEGVKSSGFSHKRKSVIAGGGVSVFFRYGFWDKPLKDDLGLFLAVQPELGLHGGWGAQEKYSYMNLSANLKGSYTTLDIPVLLVFGANIKKFKVNAALGPNFGFVLGKTKIKMSGSNAFGSASLFDEESKAQPFLMGMQIGAGFGYNFTRHHGIVVDIRGIIDFMDVKSGEDNYYFKKGDSLARRGGAFISVGYAYTF